MASTSTKECGSTAPDALSRKVREMRADIGIALDGDADRGHWSTSAATWSTAISCWR
jgi:phosphomannomutase